MFSDVEIKIKNKNQILFSRNSECLKEVRSLICEQTHLTIVLWIFDCLQEPLHYFKLKYPQIDEFQIAYDLSLAWAHGEIKMPIPKRAILNCHALAMNMDNARDVALCHAIGQGCSAVHVETHALGLITYDLTAIVVQCGYTDYEDNILSKIDFYIEKLKWWQKNGTAHAENKQWAEFLIRPEKINKEKELLLRERPC